MALVALVARGVMPEQAKQPLVVQVCLKAETLAELDS